MRLNGRRSAVNWTAAPDETESEAGSAAIAAFLARRPDSPDEAAWADVLDRLRQGLSRLMSQPLVRRDPECQAILGGLDARASLAELDAAMAALGRRVEALLAARSAPIPTGPAPDPAGPAAARVPAPGRLQVLRGFLRL